MKHESETWVMTTETLNGLWHTDCHDPLDLLHQHEEKSLVAWAAVPSKAVVLLLLTFCLLLLPLWESVIVLFCCTLLYVHSSFVIILMGKRELVALLSLSTWCLMVVVWLFFVVPWVCLRFVIVVFPDHSHYFSLGSYLTKLGNLDIDVILCIIWIEVVCSQMCICSQT